MLALYVDLTYVLARIARARLWTHCGYRVMHWPGHPMAGRMGRIRVSRAIAAAARGRLLQPEEVVHHINGMKLDDRAENLIVLADQRDHALLHARALRRPDPTQLNLWDGLDPSA
jgi:hypothetical protein